MKTSILKTTSALLLMLAFLFINVSTIAQNKQVKPANQINTFGKKTINSSNKTIKPTATNKATKQKGQKVVQDDSCTIIRSNYSYFVKFTSKSTLKASKFIKSLPRELNNRKNDTYELQNTQTDKLGYTHYKYQQFYNEVKVDGGKLLLHEKDGKLNSANGKIYNDFDINVTPSLNESQALSYAKKHIGAEKYLWENPDNEKALRELNNDSNLTLYPKEELVIAPINGIYKKENFRLCYKFNIITEIPFGIYDVFIDANSGELVNKISNISDAIGTATTLYNGTQTITTEFYGGSYRLRDNTRGVETYNATNDTNFTPGIGFTNPVDFTDDDNNWTGAFILDNVNISSISSSWWYTFIGDENPDLYIKIYDGNSNLVYDASYINNTHPPVSYNNLNLILVNPPYTLEIWDYDAVGSHDYGGSYSVTISNGTHTYSGNGNNGNYEIKEMGHPATDIHWGIEQTYDFYLNEFGRNSYDNTGSTIKSFVNPNLIFEVISGSQNQANAWPPPYNFMCYGMGDGSFMYPLVALDVAAHEFTHMVTNHSAQLYYQNESGALNESFSDIFATCVEFYALPLYANWTIGEDVMVTQPYMRSMSNPNSTQHPDTYQENYWQPLMQNSYPNPVPQNNEDNGGVHTNNGVQNHWFYLLSVGGSGTNDLGNPYSVGGIGIENAQQIAYRNLTVYLTETSKHYDAMTGSLQAAEDLFGAGLTEYWAVKDAWYAVGLGTSSNNVYCDGTVTLTDDSGTITDGSGGANYMDNSDCKWLIQPLGANTISLDFTSFDTEWDYDSVLIYDGPDTLYPLLMVWWGNTLPPQINSSGGAMLVRFMTDGSVNETGWSANYTSTGIMYCDEVTILTDYSGSFTDGSGGNNYGNNSQCIWYIAPPCASTVTLSFSSFDTEDGYDGIIIYDDLAATNQIAVLTGNTIPSPVTSTTGEMFVYFISDFIYNEPGWSANYTATGTPYCNGTTTFTSDYTYFDDGSGSSNDYCNNTDCSWLIQPTDAITITLFFDEFDIEQAGTEGYIYDAVEVYDGSNTSAPLLGTFSGDNIPQAITSTGNSMFIRFYSDISVTSEGWSAYYTSTTTNYCTGLSTLTTQSGTISDGSGANQYGNNADCQWLIQPTNATSITLSFTAFDTEQDYDGIIVYDGADTSATMLGVFTGSVIPSPVTSTVGSMLVWFLSDEIIRDNGWNASYTSCIMPGIPSTPTGTIQLCENSPNTNYTTSGATNATSYIWEIFPISAGTITGTSTTAAVDWDNIFTGTAIITVKGVNICSDEGNFSNALNITVNSLPTANAGSNVAICEGNNTILNASGGTSYNWSPATGLSATNISNPTASPTSTTTYTVTVTDANGCTNTDDVIITVNPLPPIPTITQIGNELFSSAASGNQWYDSNGIIPGAVNQTYTPAQSDNYTVIVTDVNGCSSESAPYNFIFTSIYSSETGLEVKIYPNPSKGLVYIEFENIGKDGLMIEIMNITGKIIYTKQFENNKSEKIEEIDLSRYSQGIFFVKIQSNDIMKVEKLILY